MAGCGYLCVCLIGVFWASWMCRFFKKSHLVSFSYFSLNIFSDTFFSSDNHIISIDIVNDVPHFSEVLLIFLCTSLSLVLVLLMFSRMYNLYQYVFKFTDSFFCQEVQICYWFFHSSHFTFQPQNLQLAFHFFFK